VAKFVYFDPEGSFLPGSNGLGQRRLIDAHGRRHLGEDAWALGHQAFATLAASNGAAPSKSVLENIASGIEAELPAYFDVIRKAVAEGKMKPFPHCADEVLERLGEDVGWASGIVSVLSVISQMPDNEPAETSLVYAEWFAAGCLGCLDEAVRASVYRDNTALAAGMIDAVWLMQTLSAGDRMWKSARERAVELARKRHQADPKQQAKKKVYELFLAWQQAPGKYTTDVVFARDMLDKFPTELVSEVVITRWVRAWRKELDDTLRAE
jgi:hypothetical protein